LDQTVSNRAALCQLENGSNGNARAIHYQPDASKPSRNFSDRAVIITHCNVSTEAFFLYDGVAPIFKRRTWRVLTAPFPRHNEISPNRWHSHLDFGDVQSYLKPLFGA
jgi:hypothetical protein